MPCRQHLLRGLALPVVGQDRDDGIDVGQKDRRIDVGDRDERFGEIGRECRRELAGFRR